MTRSLMRLCLLLWAMLWAASSAWASAVTYTRIDLGDHTWRYDYTLETSPGSPTFDELTIYFDAAGTGVISSFAAPAGWDPLIVQADVSLDSGGYVDALHNGGALPPESRGYLFSATYRGDDAPASQRYELIDSDGFSVVGRGMTASAITSSVPEPATSWMWVVGLAALWLAVRWRASAVATSLAAALLLTACGGGSPAAPALEGPREQADAVGTVVTSVQPIAQVTALTKLSERRVDRTHFEYVFSITVKNGPTAQSDMVALLTAAGAGATIVDGRVVVGSLAANATVVPSDTITLRVDRTTAFDVAALSWSVTAAPPTQHPVARVVIDRTSLLLSSPNQTVRLVARAVDADGDEIAGKAIAFVSSDPAVVSVAADGTVREAVPVGAASIVAKADGVSSLPTQVIAATFPERTVFVGDDEVLAEPSGMHLVGNGTTMAYETTLSGPRSFAPGTHIVSSGSKPIAGRIVSSQVVAGSATRVSIETLPLNQLVKAMKIDLVFTDAELRAQAASHAGAPPAAATALRERAAALSNPGECKGDTGLQGIVFTRAAQLKPNLQYHVAIDMDAVGVHGLSVTAQGTLDVTQQLTFAAGAALSAELKCRIEGARVSQPLPSFLAFLAMNADFGVEFGDKITLSMTAYAVSATYRKSVPVQFGVAYEAASKSFVATDESVDTSQPATIELSVRGPASTVAAALNPRATNTASFGPTSTLGLGFAYPGAPSFGMVDLAAAFEFESKYGTVYDVATDTAFGSGYVLRAVGSVKAASDLATAVALVTTDPFQVFFNPLEATANLSTSPKAVSVTADTQDFDAGQPLGVDVNLDADSTIFAGAYNVKEVRIYELPATGSALTLPVLRAAANAEIGQTKFKLQWTAPGKGSFGNGSASGRYQAFVVPLYGQLIGTVFPFPLGAVQPEISWDVAKEFSASVNPDRNWSFGVCVLGGGAQVGIACNVQSLAYDERAQNFSDLDTWRHGESNSFGAVAHNGTNHDISVLHGLPWEPPDHPQTSVTYQPGQFYMHPGPGRQIQMVDWRGPAFKVHVHATFKVESALSNGVNALLMRDTIGGRVIDRVAAVSSQSETVFDQDMTIQPDQRIIFGIENNGHFDYDTTHVNIHITKIP